MTTLHDRLAELAEDAGPGSPGPDLWDQGLRIHRRRRLGTLVVTVLCILLVGALGLVDWHVSNPETQPVTGEPELALPDRVEKPSPWLPGTDGKPFGPLVAVIRADRGSWTGSSPGVVGVSAATGEYRFLDLPSFAGQAAVLSPDGRYVGYWITGSLSGSPGVPGEDPVTGFAVFDLVAGRSLVRQDVGSEHGLMPLAMTWVDGEHLGISYSPLRAYDDRAGTGGGPDDSAIVTVTSGDVEPFSDSMFDGGGGGWVLTGWGSRTRLQPLAERPAVELRGQSGVPPVVDPTGRQVAGLRAIKRGGDTTLTPAPLAVGALQPGQRLTLEPVPGDRRYYKILGWRDDHTVVASGRYLAGGGWYAYAVDVRTGAQQKVLRSSGDSTQLAAGLLDLPVVTRPEPPRPWDPRLVTGLAVGIVVLSGAAVLGWRRRVGP